MIRLELESWWARSACARSVTRHECVRILLQKIQRP
jgi:hypothetical protein